ncbi:MAG TPA: hypothetical protein VJ044_13570, partial [Candidatus Hodarchaeales archaeon]|nr:hypothetical protein [Candidatus Hodarchaeales archaeon]
YLAFKEVVKRLAQAKEQLAARENEIAAKILEEAADICNKYKFTVVAIGELRQMAQERRNK